MPWLELGKASEPEELKLSRQSDFSARQPSLVGDTLRHLLEQIADSNFGFSFSVVKWPFGSDSCLDPKRWPAKTLRGLALNHTGVRSHERVRELF